MKKTLLMMSLLATAPLFAQAPAAVAAPVAAVTAEARAAACGALAALPASADSFLMLTNVGTHLQELAGDALAADPQAAMLLNVDSVALAASDAAVADLQQWAPLLGKVSSMESLGALAAAWSESATDDSPSAAAAELADASMAELMGKLKDARLAPVQLAVAFKGESAEQMPVMLKGLMLMSAMSSPVVTPVDVTGNTPKSMDTAAGICLDLAALADDDDSMRELLAGKKLYALLAVKGNALVLTVTTDPALVQLPASVEGSLAATAKAAAFDAMMPKGLMLAASNSAAMQKAEADANLSSLRALVQVLQGAFNGFAENAPASAATFKAASAAVATVAQQVEAYAAPGANPATVQVWRDKDVHIVFEQDSKGISFLPAKGVERLGAVSSADDTLLYYASSPAVSSRKADQQALCNAAGDIFNGVLAGLSGDARLQAESVMAQVSAFNPMLQKAWAALGTMAGATGQGGALVLSEGKPVPPQDGETMEQMPILSWQTPVADRAALTQGWQQLCAAVDEAGTMMGEEGSLSASLPVETAEQNGTVYYTVGGDDDGDVVPTAAVSDTLLTLSSTAAKARSLVAVASAAAETETAGAVFTVNMKPIARTVRAMAHVFGDSEYDEEKDEVTMEDNDSLLEAADALDAVAEKIRSVSGSITTPGDRIRTEINFNLK